MAQLKRNCNKLKKYAQNPKTPKPQNPWDLIKNFEEISNEIVRWVKEQLVPISFELLLDQDSDVSLNDCHLNIRAIIMLYLAVSVCHKLAVMVSYSVGTSIAG